LSGIALMSALGIGTAAAAPGGHSGSAPPNGCPVQSPAGGIAAEAGEIVYAPCGYAVGKTGMCPPNSPGGQSDSAGPPCGKGGGQPTTTSTTAGPVECGEANPPTGPVSSIVFGVGVTLGGSTNPLGAAVEDIACALFVNLSL
jgi:hypothetical protein